MKKIIVALVSVLLIFNTAGVTQNVATSNVIPIQNTETYIIFYDIPANDDSLNVQLAFYKNSDPTFKYYPKYISGDVGIGKFSGAKKKITWYFKNEPKYILAGSGSGIYFKVFATKIPKKINEKEIIIQPPVLIDTPKVTPKVNSDSIALAKLKKEQEDLQKKNDSLAQINKKIIEEQNKIIAPKKQDTLAQENKKPQELKEKEAQKTPKNQEQNIEIKKEIKVDDTSDMAAPNINFFAGYGSHGIVVGGNYKIKYVEKIKSDIRIYMVFGFQNYTFKKPIIFNGLAYNSETGIVSYGAGVEQEFYFKRWLHLAPFAGFRFDDAHFKNNYINEKIGDGELIRYEDGNEVGSRLNKDYGVSGLMIDLGGCVKIKLTKHFWLIGKVAVSPVKYNSNKTIYGKYWADTPVLNDYAIKRSIVREEVALSYGF